MIRPIFVDSFKTIVYCVSESYLDLWYDNGVMNMCRGVVNMGYVITDLGSDLAISSNIDLGVRNADFIVTVFNELTVELQDILVDNVYEVNILFGEKLEDAEVVIVRYRAWKDGSFKDEVIFEIEVKVFEDRSIEVLDAFEVDEEAYLG